ncbi:MAG: matrixin family metalloprotease [Sphingobacteriales bacterium]|jgi:hypothetical protein
MAHQHDIKKVLQEMGYLYQNPSNDAFASIKERNLPTSTSEAFDEASKEALKQFQSFYGLTPTGEPDEKTLQLISSPRCGNPDRPKLRNRNGMSATFVVQGNKWGKGNLTYAFRNFTPDLPVADIIAAIRTAMDTWSQVCLLTFTEVSGNADIMIQFVRGNHGDGTSFDGANGVLAHAFFPPPNGGEIAGDIHFDDDERWILDNTPGGYDLLSVAVHELGHSLGLDHSNERDAIMFAFYSGKRALHKDDIDGIRSVYGDKNRKTTLTDTAIGQPALSTRNGSGVLAWTGTDRDHRLNTMQTQNGRIWLNKCTLAETSLSGPSITNFNGMSYMAWRGVGNNFINIIASQDGQNWVRKLTLAETTFHSPCILGVNGKLYLAWTGTDNQRRLNVMESTDGINWTGKQTLGDNSIDGPSLAVLGGNLLISWTGTDAQRRINVMTYNGVSWINKVTLAENSFWTPSMLVNGNELLLSWSGTNPDNNLNILRSGDGVNFGNKVTIGETSGFAPNLGIIDNAPVIVWTGKDQSQSLNTLFI